MAEVGWDELGMRWERGSPSGPNPVWVTDGRLLHGGVALPLALVIRALVPKSEVKCLFIKNSSSMSIPNNFSLSLFFKLKFRFISSGLAQAESVPASQILIDKIQNGRTMSSWGRKHA